jgi:fermentation-respiration switch protein FrsA (DUF1100 family)
MAPRPTRLIALALAVSLLPALSGCGKAMAGASAYASPRGARLTASEATTRPVTGQDIFQDAIAQSDRDHNGALEAPETTGTWLETEFSKLDASRDGHLTADEFARFLDAQTQKLGPESWGAVGGIGFGVVGSALAAYLTYAGIVGSNDLMLPKKDDYTKDPGAYGIPFERVEFKSHDGLKLVGWYVPAAKPTTKAILLLHGHASKKDVVFRKYGNWLRSEYNLFLYDQRYSGESEGKYVTLGYYERHDAKLALDQLRSRGNTSIGLMGESMGGAVAINVGATVPDVKAVWNDCAFDSLQDAIAPRAAARKYPLADLVAVAVRKTAGLRAKGHLEEADPIHWVDKIGPRPFYLVHGLKDDETLPVNGEKLFKAAKDPKESWWTAEAKHANSWKVYPEEYKQRTFAFFEKAL